MEGNAMGSLVFDEHAETYDAWFIQNENVLASEILLIKHALGSPGETLSVGCGSGLFEYFLRRDHGIEIREGIEPSEAMASIARKRGLNVRIAPAERIPHEDRRFDTVLMNGIPAYLKNLDAALREARRVLHPGGHVVIGDVPASSGYGLLYRTAGLVGSWDDPHMRQVAPEHPYPVDFVKDAHWRNTAELAQGLRELGFAGLEFAQTLTTHPRFSNDRVEEPSSGYTRGGYVAVRARYPRA
jgi:ubiquinone/menaquinone biosynthesis C-methylase UbiE